MKMGVYSLGGVYMYTNNPRAMVGGRLEPDLHARSPHARSALLACSLRAPLRAFVHLTRVHRADVQRRARSSSQLLRAFRLELVPGRGRFSRRAC